MNENYDALQTYLERLEAGDTAATVITNLSQEEAELVEFAAALRQVDAPERDADKVAMQRAALMQFASSNQVSSPQTERKRPFYQPLLDWVNGRTVVEQIGLAVIGLLVLLFVSFPSLRGSETQVAEEGAEADRIVKVIPADSPDEPVDADVTNVVDADDAEVAVVPPPALPHQLFIPSISSALEWDATMATLDNIQGVVEVQQTDGSWTAVSRIDTVRAGQRIRTSKLSQATLTFYDGSEAVLNANTELSIDQLNALRPEDGYRTVVMTQLVG
ncbi:MAG: hypothetical protein GY943_34545, partial [Chloroflexi bacterium]|nr:hypothetical protein [Chloroflexota bacterium]